MKLTFRYNLADTLEDVRPKTLPDTLEDVKAEALIYGPTNTLPEEGFRNVFACLRKDSTRLRLRKHLFTLTETYKKVIRFRWKRSYGNTGKHNVSANGNMCLPSWI